MQTEQKENREKGRERAAPKGGDWRDHPVEQEGDKDIKEGGMEQTGRRDKEDR